MARARDEFPNLEEAKPKKIPPPAGESRALPKYFEHAGALLTADGTNLLMARIIDGINENRWLNDSLK